MATKWTPERRAKFRATMRAKKNGGAKQTLPPKLERALYEHYRKQVITELLKRSG